MVFFTNMFKKSISLIKQKPLQVSAAFMTVSTTIAAYPLVKNHQQKKLFESWAVKHLKEYKNDSEKRMRFVIFKENLREIQAHNSGKHSYKMGLNKFSDLTMNEFKAFYTGGKIKGLDSYGDDDLTEMELVGGEEDLSDEVDWRNVSAVSPTA